MQIQLVTLLIQDNSCLGMRLGQNDNEIPKAIQHCNNVGFWARPGLGWVWALMIWAKPIVDWAVAQTHPYDIAQTTPVFCQMFDYIVFHLIQNNLAYVFINIF